MHFLKLEQTFQKLVHSTLYNAIEMSEWTFLKCVDSNILFQTSFVTFFLLSPSHLMHGSDAYRVMGSTSECAHPHICGFNKSHLWIILSKSLQTTRHNSTVANYSETFSKPLKIWWCFQSVNLRFVDDVIYFSTFRLPYLRWRWDEHIHLLPYWLDTRYTVCEDKYKIPICFSKTNRLNQKLFCSIETWNSYMNSYIYGSKLHTIVGCGKVISDVDWFWNFHFTSMHFVLTTQDEIDKMRKIRLIFI